MHNNLFLCFVKNVGVDSDGNNVYDFLFTDDTDTFFGENFEYTPACLVNNLEPFEGSYQVTKEIRCELKLKLAQESCCYSMQDCFDGIHPVAFEDLTGLSEYPEEGRLVLHFGLPYQEVERLLSAKNILLEEKRVGK